MLAFVVKPEFADHLRKTVPRLDESASMVFISIEIFAKHQTSDVWIFTNKDDLLRKYLNDEVTEKQLEFLMKE
jgi:hypothetical protein